MSMSTPVSQLPANKGTSQAPPVDDPEVLSMLNEMEHEVQEATKQQHQSVAPPPMPMPMAHPPSTPHVPTVKKITRKGIWDVGTAQKAAVFAAIALIVFYPSTMTFLYSKLPKFESIFASYDVFIRTAILVVLLYFAMMYLPSF